MERLQGYVFVITRDTKSKAIAEVHRRGTGYHFAFLSHGRDGSVLLRHLKNVPSAGARYELRILGMPQVHLLALWRHRKDEELMGFAFARSAKLDSVGMVEGPDPLNSKEEQS